ncbi:gephyrin-like molybdotransferase Glp [Algiphilus sp.]|uniref:molybdopterin molybdotransferase MoeA n=1 Tax=Algiphilus sp. TaxID=1872431 RepID=UPI003B51F94F
MAHDAGSHAAVPVHLARERMLSSVTPLQAIETVPLAQALGRVLARPLQAGCSVPPADNSAMDGYAVRADDIAPGRAVPIAARIPAGVMPSPLEPGTAARIFTGACIPAGADSVVMQERCRVHDGRLEVDGTVATGDNIRRAGEDIVSGSEILPAGQCLKPTDIGLAATVGCAALEVVLRPRVAILVTGDELVPPGRSLRPGQIFESNAALLEALLRTIGAEVLPIQRVADALDATQFALEHAASTADLIVSSGGVSVGEEDHVRAAMEAVGTLDLWKIAVKPGKPVAFGRVGAVPFIGLPGNPVSVLAAYLLFAAPVLRRLQGRTRLFPEPVIHRAGFTRDKPIQRDEFLRVRLRNGRLEAFPHQGSGVLSSAVWADGLARVPSQTTVAEHDGIEYFGFDSLMH